MSRGLPVFPAGSVVTCGSFDGVHLGHQAVLGEVKARAERLGAASLVVTFEPHPASVLSKQGAPLRLTTREEQAEFLAELGLDYLLVLRFDRGLAEQSAEEFVRDTLLAELGMRELVLGENHGLGRDRRGDSATLPELGRRLGFGVTVVGPVPDSRGEPISSTRIRNALVAGELGAVAEWLGRLTPQKSSSRPKLSALPLRSSPSKANALAGASDRL